MTEEKTQEDLELEATQEAEEKEKINKVEKRIKDLSEKVKLTSTERDEQIELVKEKDGLLTASNKERDFFKGFSTLTTKYGAASEYQDQIKEKVMSGYDVEDATISILAKEGKLEMPKEEPKKKDSPAGGSATNPTKISGEKSLDEMTRDEKRAELEKMLG